MSETNRVAAVLGDSKLIEAHQADVSRIRERSRRRRLLRAILVLGSLDTFLWYRYSHNQPLHWPKLPPDAILWAPGLILIVAFGLVILIPFIVSTRSPHMMIRPEHIELGLSDVRGLDAQVDEIVRSLNVFLGYATFREVLGGNPRRGILFEGPPGTGKTYLAKAMAKQAGVPFLFVSAPAFQSMWFGLTNVRLRRFFRAMRRAAKREGGAIGFIEELDSIGSSRSGLSMDDRRDGRAINRLSPADTAGMVNELLIQLQSFDQPTGRQRALGRLVEWLNGYLPDGRALKLGKPKYHNLLLIAATNRADALDPALLRPGRLDRRLYFDLPTKKARRDLVDFFMERKSHHPELDQDASRERIAHDTFGYTPVMIEHLFDEALLVALREGRDGMTVSDVYRAKLTEEIGLAQEASYSEGERAAVATHEAGHAAAAHLLGIGRRLQVLSIIKRRGSLGLLAHGDIEERFTQSRSELEALVAIALGGMASEELFIGESSSGPGSDLAYATEVACMMVGALGMAGSLISYEAVGEGLVARRNLVARVLADQESKTRVDSLLAEQKDRVRGVLSANRDLVEALRDALIERDELVGEQITEVIEAALARRSGASDRIIDLTEEPSAPSAD